MTRWTLGANDTVLCDGMPVAPHWLVGMLNRCAKDLALLRAVESAAWALVDESANEVHSCNVVVHSLELQQQLEAAIDAAGRIKEVT